MVWIITHVVLGVFEYVDNFFFFSFVVLFLWSHWKCFNRGHLKSNCDWLYLELEQCPQTLLANYFIIDCFCTTSIQLPLSFSLSPSLSLSERLLAIESVVFLLFFCSLYAQLLFTFMPPSLTDHKIILNGKTVSGQLNSCYGSV